jgi:hypothetical protein
MQRNTPGNQYESFIMNEIFAGITKSGKKEILCICLCSTEKIPFDLIEFDKQGIDCDNSFVIDICNRLLSHKP